MHLSLHVMGPIRLLTAGGRNLTPRGRKTRAALVVLATAPEMRLPRARLQDLLWSESPTAQGAASLRQMLHDLRSALGPDYAGVLLAGDGWVGLDPRRLHVDLAAAIGHDGARAEFAADLDMAEPEFEDWLRDMRLSLEETARPAPLVLVLATPQGNDDQARMFASVVLQDAGMRAAELIPARLVTQSAWDGAGNLGMVAGASCLRDGPEALLQLGISDLTSTVQLWSQQFVLPTGQATRGVAQAAGAFALALIRQAAGLATPARPVMPVMDLFGFSAQRLLAADRLLGRDDFADNALGQSMRAFLRYTLIIERQGGTPAALLDEAEGFTARARRMAPGDPNVLAVSSLLRSWRGDPSGALDLARMACRLAPGHDLARMALSQALNDVGRDAEALTTTLRVPGGPMAILGQASWLLRRAVTQVRLGRLRDAEVSANAALAHAPDSRAVLRFLAALRYHRGDEMGTAEALHQLRRLEPDFSLDLMASPDYPVSSLRRAGLLGITRSGL